MTIFLKTCLNFIYGYRDNYGRNEAYYQDCRNIRLKILRSETFEEKIPVKTNLLQLKHVKCTTKKHIITSDKVSHGKYF